MVSNFTGITNVKTTVAFLDRGYMNLPLAKVVVTAVIV